MSTGTLRPVTSNVIKLVAKPNGAVGVGAYLGDALRLANQNPSATAWFALRTDATTFWIVEAFMSEGDRLEHLDEATTAALLGNVSQFLDGPPEIFSAEVLGSKLPVLRGQR